MITDFKKYKTESLPVDIDITVQVDECDCVHVVPGTGIVSEAQAIQDIIYSKDPVTGFPSSDLSVSAEHMSDPSVRQYISEVIQRPVPRRIGTDMDSALDTMIRPGEDAGHYAERMSSIIENSKSSDSEPTPEPNVQPKNE